MLGHGAIGQHALGQGTDFNADPGALSGSTSLTFTTAGILRGAAALAGTSSLTFAPAGILRGAAALAATSSLTFTTTGNLVGAAGLLGTTSITFDASANLTIVATPVAPAGGGYVPGFWTDEHRKIKEREEGVPEPIEALSKLPEFIVPKTWGDDDEEDELSELMELMEIMDHAARI
jgi:hypothetical protein